MNYLIQQLAVSYGYNNPLLCISHGRSQLGLSKYANHGVAGAAILQIGGHASHKTSGAGYQRPNQQSADQIIASKYGSPSKSKQISKLSKPRITRLARR